MCFTCVMQGLLQIQPLTIEIRKAATNQSGGYPSKSNILLFWSDGRFSSNETPRFPARLLSLFLVVKNRGKRIKTNQQTLEISGIFRFVFIIVYGHSCASLLLANGVPLKQIQEWLGHSDFSTTANVYAHLDYSSKLSSAQAMENGIFLPESGDFKSKWEKIKPE